MKISVAQIDCNPACLFDNHRKILQYIEHAANNDSELIILPELADTGYDMDVVREVAETWEGKCFVDKLRAAADDYGIAIVCGLAEREGENLYNSAAIIDREGRLLNRYRKTHLFSLAGEHKVFTPGTEFVAISLSNVRFGIAICYDIRFPEMCRKLVTVEKIEALIVIAAFPHPRQMHWNTLLAARAMENQIYVVAANRIGTDRNLCFCGSSSIIEPSGLLVNRAPDVEVLLTETLDLTKIGAARSEMNLLGDRRVDLY